MPVSTVLSDALLSAVAFAGAILLARARVRNAAFLAGALGFFGLTAAFGSARFAGLGTDALHESGTWTCRWIALPLFSVAFAATGMQRKLPRPAWYGVGIVLAGLGYWRPMTFGTVAEAVTLLGLVTGAAALWPRGKARSGLAVAGIALIALAGLLIGTQGEWLGLPRVDWFHFALAGGYGAVAASLLVPDP